jgi:hypothetical protein
MQIFKITGICSFDGDEADIPCTCYPDVCIDCLTDNCEYFVMYDGEMDPSDFEDL